MKIEITYDKKFIQLTNLYPYEMQILKKEFTREIKNAWLLKKKSKLINTERTYINDMGYMPIGLWLDLIKVCQQYNFKLEYSKEFIDYMNSFTKLSYESFENYIKETFKDAAFPDGSPFYPYKFQIEAAWNLLRFKRSSAEISTSAGKTLISFIIFKYLIDVCKVKKILYIVPSVDLAEQSAEKYELYESYLKVHNHNWSTGILRSGLKKAEKEAAENCNILFGTFQSLGRRDENYFLDFEALIEDECCHPDTIITMADGTFKKISNVNIGDEVITLNEDTLQKEVHEVEYVYKNLSPHDKIYNIELESGDILKLTGNHKVLTSNRGYVRVDELTETDELIKY